MTDSTLNRFVARGTTVERLAFVPTPPTPASGPSSGYLWFDDTLDVLYSYDFAAVSWVASAGLFSRVLQIDVSDPNGSAITTGDGKAYVRVNSVMNGWNLIAVAASLNPTAPSTSGIPTIQIHNETQAADMLSTKLTIDVNETDSKDAAVPAVIDAANDDVATGDALRIDIDVAGTGAKGLIVELTFRLP